MKALLIPPGNSIPFLVLKGDEDDLLPAVNKSCVRGRDLKENLGQLLFLCGIIRAI